MMAPMLSLGAMHRSLLAHLDTRGGMRVGIHFEERTSVPAEGEHAGGGADRIERRTFDADLVVRDGRVVQARLDAGAAGAEPLTVRVADVDGAAVYAAGNGGYGALRVRPDLFGLDDFGRRLDEIAITDAVIDSEMAGSTGRIVIEAEVDAEAFSRLLRVFGGNEPSHTDLPVLSHSVTLSAAPEVTLDYWWSLLGLDEIEGNPVRNNVVVCHVEASIGAITAAAAAEPRASIDPALPALEDLDAVWELARAKRATG
jgi:hypothetical protein